MLRPFHRVYQCHPPQYSIHRRIHLVSYRDFKHILFYDELRYLAYRWTILLLLTASFGHNNQELFLHYCLSFDAVGKVLLIMQLINPKLLSRVSCSELYRIDLRTLADCGRLCLSTVSYRQLESWYIGRRFFILILYKSSGFSIVNKLYYLL
jgi:hypothetical protein